MQYVFKKISQVIQRSRYNINQDIQINILLIVVPTHITLIKINSNR